MPWLNASLALLFAVMAYLDQSNLYVSSGFFVAALISALMLYPPGRHWLMDVVGFVAIVLMLQMYFLFFDFVYEARGLWYLAEGAAQASLYLIGGTALLVVISECSCILKRDTDHATTSEIPKFYQKIRHRFEANRIIP